MPSKFDDNVIDFPEPRIPARSRFADEIFETPAVLVLPARSKFADAVEEVYADGTVAWLIAEWVSQRTRPGSRGIGDSHRCVLRLLQRLEIGKKMFAKLRPIDFIEHCKDRIAGGVLPQTVMQDMTYLSGVLKYAFEILELPGAEETCKAYKKAKPQLIREQLISKSNRRDRLPTPDELARLRAHFTTENARKLNKIDMVLVMDAELVTGRRISELCRIERQHVNVEKRTCMVYNLKNAKGKGYHAEFALIEGAWELFERRLREIPDSPDAKLFPFKSKSCSARYTMAKTVLKIVGLRMHDNRAECFVRLLDKGYSALQVRKGVSLHRNPNTFENVYARIKAEDLHNGPKAKVAA